jgi:hypothetical protein
MDSSTKIIYKDLKSLFHVECLNLIILYNIFLSDSIDELIGSPYIIILAPPLHISIVVTPTLTFMQLYSPFKPIDTTSPIHISYWQALFLTRHWLPLFSVTNNNIMCILGLNLAFTWKKFLSTQIYR